MGYEITIVDDSDYVGYAASLVREGEIYMTDVASMVANVLAALRKHYRNCAPGRVEYRFNFGDYVRADPNGTFTQDAGRP